MRVKIYSYINFNVGIHDIIIRKFLIEKFGLQVESINIFKNESSDGAVLGEKLSKVKYTERVG
ncbi:hypothetical protein RBU49_03930 [Clostridium sp. MB40-C1]|uniref:hypothetical protein n=1 Tax=Clostridium sp. MB40-C1 TaxID=3070996 RepID=UPI0027E0C0D3|nr:hypothetical protein [Clostridium sp. MB40-C1]WMJ81418.1 hypothetical protein RBU49_03930 [Clostridium sp. MB40-C1]